MKRFLLFCGSKYYPLGGWDDFKGDFDAPEAAVADAIRRVEKGHGTDDNVGWWQVVDTSSPPRAVAWWRL